MLSVRYKNADRRLFLGNIEIGTVFFLEDEFDECGNTIYMKVSPVSEPHKQDRAVNLHTGFIVTFSTDTLVVPTVAELEVELY